MGSFFEKLKKGMGIEVGEEEIEKPEEKKPKIRKPKKIEIKGEAKELEIKKPSAAKREKVSLVKEPLEIKEEKIEKEEVKRIEKEKEEKPSFASADAKASVDKKAAEDKEKWLEPEGELAIDVYQTENELVIQSAIAGVKPEDLSVSIEGDVLTIEGQRQKSSEEAGNYFYQECFWGRFARQIILPVEIDPNKIEATLKEGVLTIRMPKIQREKKRKIVIKE